MLDTLIRGARIVDGSGAPAFFGEIGIQGDRIVLVRDRIDQPAGKVIEAFGLVACPGFVDIHRHADLAVFRPGFGELEARQGVTSIVNGQCGLSTAPCPPERRAEMFEFLRTIVGAAPAFAQYNSFAEYLALLRRQPLPIHVGCCVGNGAVRMAAAGFANGALSPRQLETAREHLRASLQAGALGVTLGITYAPENQYRVESFLQVLAPMRDFDLPLATHMRGEGRTLHQSEREVLAVAEGLGVALEISHFKSIGKAFWGEYIDQALAIVEEARGRGQPVTIDAYPWTAGASQLYQYLPPSFQDGGYDAVCARLRDPARRAALKAELSDPSEAFENQLYYIGWENTMISGVSTPENRRYVGLTVEQIAEQTGKDPYEAAFDLLAEEHCGVGMINFISSEADNRRILQKDYCSIISDAIYGEGSLPHPRVYGTFPRVLATLVRDEGVLSLESAIHKMTRQPAEVYHLERKGLLAEGMDADLVLFDPDRVQTRATYRDPACMPTGFARVLVAGQTVVDYDVFDRTAHPGTVLVNKYAQ